MTITDFFDTTLEQCTTYADALRGMDGTEALVASLDECAEACADAIADGRLRVSMTPVVALLPVLVQEHEALPEKLRTDFQAAMRAVGVKL